MGRHRAITLAHREQAQVAYDRWLAIAISANKPSDHGRVVAHWDSYLAISADLREMGWLPQQERRGA